VDQLSLRQFKRWSQRIKIHRFHQRPPCRLRMVEDAFVKEDQGIHRLVLGGGSDVCVYGEVGQERFDLGFGGEEVLTGPHAVETNKPHDPVHVGSLGVNGVVVQTEYLSDLIEEFWLLTFCRVRHIRLP